MTAAPLGAAIEATGLLVVHEAASAEGAHRPVAALRGLDLRVDTGEVAAVVGPSGSGKTSLLRVLGGLVRPTAGSVTVFDTSLDGGTPGEIRRYRRDVVAIVDQHYRRALSPYLPALEIVAMPLALRGRPRAEREARAQELLAAMGLGDRGPARVSELSGGEQQRLAVAAALAIRPKLLLADEPTGELDAVATDRLLTLVRDLVRAEGTTALIVTHDPAVEAIADRVVILEDGRAVAERVGPLGTAEVPATDAAGWRAPESTWRHAAYDVPAAPPMRGAAAKADAADDADRAGSVEPAVVLEHVARSYGERGAIEALRDVDATIAIGGVTVVTGPSGSGKSTLLRLIAGLDQPDAGRVVVFGEDLAALDREALAAIRGREIGIAEQARGLVPFLDVRENVALATALHESPAGATDHGASDAADPVDAILDRVGIAHLARRQPTELSAGERTRTAIARALVTRPRLLLLDEPSATLDRVNAARIAELLAELGRELTVVVATHDPALIAIARQRIELAGRAVPAPVG
jgi:ABC-type lipoprotein export system ATPase subunit